MRSSTSRSTKSLFKREEPIVTPYKILYLQSTSEIGGADISLLRIVEKIDKTRFDPYIILPSEGPLVEHLAKHASCIFMVKEMWKLTTRKGLVYLLLYIINFPRAVWKIARIIREQHIELVHTNTLHNLYGFLAAKLTKTPHIWHVREIVWQSKILRVVEGWLAKHFTERLVATSEAVADMFKNGKGRYPACLRKIPNGVDVEVFSPENNGETIFEDLKLTRDKPLVGLVARLDHWKGIHTFLESIALCKEEYPDARYLVVGGPIEGREDYAKKMLGIAESLHLNDVVYFTGWRYHPKDMPKVYAALTILVLASSRPEPFGLVLLEAMATGKPVVATDHGGPREICANGETAILVPPANPLKMASAILTLLRDREKALAMGRAGRDRVTKFYNQSNCIKMLEALYVEVLRR